ncbi:MAG: SDR family oxidoreductase [Methylococcaceae bacterium]|nr:SDR family oxidoreductase [Methylococcaceae bacterium]
MAKILIIGCGVIGMALGNVLSGKGHQVTGLRRNPPVSDANTFKFITADIQSRKDIESLDSDFDTLFFIVSPDERSENNYRNLYETGLNHLLARYSQANKTKWFFVSSTSVYSQTEGEWVNEASLAEPDNVCSQVIRQAELRLIETSPKHTVVRFSGIYGPGREHLLRMAQQSPAIQKSPPYYTNRIHQDDCVAVLAFLLEQHLAGVTMESCYLATDDNPAPMWEVITWLTQQMNCNPPVEKTVGTVCSMNKRCDNSKLKALGYQFKYPGFRHGYLELIQ